MTISRNVEQQFADLSFDEMLALAVQLSAKGYVWRKRLLSVFKYSADGNLQNAISMALRKYRSKELFDELIAKISNPDNINCRGTFVRSLAVFDCREIFEFLVSLVLTGNFEVSHEAYLILESIDCVGGDAVSRSAAGIKNATALHQGVEDWREELLESILQMIE